MMDDFSYEKLSDYIISYCVVNNIDITNKKLQKLTFYCDAWHLALLKKPLIPQNFEAWVHGAVLKPLYFQYSDCGFSPISKLKNEAEELYESFKSFISDDAYNVISKVLKKYSQLSANELEHKNHDEYPWIHARSGLFSDTSCSNEISKVITMNFYSSRALLEEMKTVEYNIFKITPEALIKAQERLSTRTLFKKTDENYQEYENFILNSYNSSKILTERAEYGAQI